MSSHNSLEQFRSQAVALVPDWKDERKLRPNTSIVKLKIDENGMLRLGRGHPSTRQEERFVSPRHLFTNLLDRALRSRGDRGRS